jgi:hypothetical protein
MLYHAFLEGPNDPGRSLAKDKNMFGFRMSKKPTSQKDSLEDILGRHKANLAAERQAPRRNDAPPVAPRKKPGFGKRRVNS